jgi:hypothetical protein
MAMGAELNDQFETRLTAVERSLRRWKLFGFTLALVVVGMGANVAVQDATFGTVKAKSFEVVDSKGLVIGLFQAQTVDGIESSGLVIRDSPGKTATVMTPGNEPLRINKH